MRPASFFVSAFFAFSAFSVGAAAVGCSTMGEAPVASDEAELRDLQPGEVLGTIASGETKGPVAYKSPPRYRAFRFSATAGAKVDVSVASADGDALAYVTDAKFKTLAKNDDADPTTKDARITMTLAKSGEHYIVFRERDEEPATFNVTLSIDAADADAGAPPVPPVPGTPCSTLDEVAQKACGKCGVQQALCVPSGAPPAAQWSEYGACSGEFAGGCVPGTVVEEPCGNCGTRKSTCTAYCAFAAGTCEGQPANSCAPGSVDFTGAACVAGTYRQRECSNSCTWTGYSPTCELPPSTVEVPAAIGAVSTTIVTLDTAHLAPRLSGTCPGATFSQLSTAHAYTQIHNPTGKTAVVSVYNSQTPGGAIFDTVLAAYPTANAPVTNAQRQACSVGVSSFGRSSLTGNVRFASLDGDRAVAIPPGATMTIYTAAFKSSTGTVLLNVKTEQLK